MCHCPVMEEKANLQPQSVCGASDNGVLGSLQLAGQRILARRSVEIARLRRHHSARKLQRAWRSFARASLTTRHFAVAFVRTGLPGLAIDSLVRCWFNKLCWVKHPMTAWHSEMCILTILCIPLYYIRLLFFVCTLGLAEEWHC